MWFGGSGRPTGVLGDITHLGGLVKDKLGIALDPGDLSAIHCSAKVRYGEEKSTREEALASHDALVRVLGALSKVKAHHTHRT